MDLRVRDGADGCRFDVKVSPKASRSALAGVQDGVLRLRIAAPPVDGEANEEVRYFLSRTLRCPKTAVTILKGGSSKRKTVRVSGMSGSELIARLET